MSCVVCLLKAEEPAEATFVLYGHQVCKEHVGPVFKAGGELRVIRGLRAPRQFNNLRLGERLRELRKMSNVTQKALSEVTGINQPEISEIESGKRAPGEDVWIRLLAPMGMTLDEFMAERED